MNWAQENKFLAGYGIVMLIGVGALGFKVYTASSAYDDANARYAAKASSYNTLRHLAPYPNRENLAAVEAQKKEAADVINSFQAGLAKREFPLDEITPEKFQDVLKTAVTKVRAKATAANVNLPKDKFYLGFNRYETAPPDKDASSPLGRDLKAIQWVVEQCIAAPILELKDLKRADIPEEKGRAAATPRPAPGGGNNQPGASGRSRPDLLKIHTFDITINCKQHQLAKVLNAIINPGAPQFLIPRNIRIAQVSPIAPPRIAPGMAAAPPPGAPATPVPAAPVPQFGAPPVAAPAAPAAATPAAGVTYSYLVGEETIDATIHLEIVDFAEPAAAAAAPVK